MRRKWEKSEGGFTGGIVRKEYTAYYDLSVLENA